MVRRPIETLGEKLQKLRVKARWTQDALAEAAGVPLWSLRNWEQDHRLPGLVPAYRLAQALKVPLEDLAACALATEGKVVGRPARKPRPAGPTRWVGTE